MREIKFRGKSIITGEWVYGCLTRYSIYHSYITVDLVENDTPRVLTATVGQYTGMKDKNGKEIYEGDIVKSSLHGSSTFIIEFIEGGFCCTRDGKYPVDINRFSSSIGCQIEVIGNIYENQEAPSVAQEVASDTTEVSQ